MKRSTIALLAGMIFCYGGRAMAVITATEDSSLFENAYEGGPVTVSGGVASGFGNTGLTGSDSNYTLTSDGNILDCNGLTPNVGVLFLQSSSWDADALDANGWTWEMSFKVIGVKATTAFNLRIGDAENSATHQQDIYSFGLDSISNLGAPAWNVPVDLTDAFHVFRVAQAANSDEFNVWLDGNLIEDYTLTSGFSGSDNLWIGDGSGSQDGDFQFDYIRWTSQGGFAPVPEPASFLLMLLGAGTTAIWRRRSRCRAQNINTTA